MSYLRPASLDEFLSALRDHPGARILAGATDVVPQGRKSGQFPEALIDPGVIRGQFEGIRGEGDRLWIGAFTPFQEIVDDSRLNRDYRVLVEAARWIGSRQIRNMATLGGNIANASPAGDSMPALLVYEAVLRCRGLSGAREVPLAEFYLGYKKTALQAGEFIEAVLLPPPPPVRKDYYRKAGPRRVLSISRTALAGLAAGRDGAANSYRLAAAGVAPVPVRLRTVEALLQAGLPPAPAESARESMTAALRQDIAPITDLRGSAEYKFQVTLNFILEMIEEL
jgi:CO/xanthine dehydrogenase FAD-binding subunit